MTEMDIESKMLEKSIRTPFEILDEKINFQIEELKELNNQQQSFNGMHMSSNDITQQRMNFKMKAEKLGEQLKQLEKLARGAQKETHKKLLRNYTMQVERNKKIMRSFINQSFQHKFSRISMLKQSKGQGELQQDQLKYFVDEGLIQIQGKHHQDMNTPPPMVLRGKTISREDLEEHLEENMIDLENQLIDERQRDLDDIEQDAAKLLNVAESLAQEVNGQDAGLNLIQVNQQKTLSNLGGAAQHLEAADATQRRSKLFVYMAGGVGVLIVAVIALVLVLVLRS